MWAWLVICATGGGWGVSDEVEGARCAQILVQKTLGQKELEETPAPAALVVSPGQQHSDTLGEHTDHPSLSQESAQVRQTSMWPEEPTFRQQTGEKSQNIVSPKKVLI